MTLTPYYLSPAARAALAARAVEIRDALATRRAHRAASERSVATCRRMLAEAAAPFMIGGRAL